MLSLIRYEIIKFKKMLDFIFCFKYRAFSRIKYELTIIKFKNIKSFLILTKN